jgi:hypothetical protein
MLPGNAPFPLNIVALHSTKGAKEGAQTTICDGVVLFANMSKELQKA